MIFTGLLLHRLPAHAAEKEFALFPKDWKHWARLLLGLGAVNHINKGMNWNPPPWLQAAETVLVLHPITSGITKRSIGQLAFTLPYVVAIVEANILLGKGYLWAKERFTGQKQDPNQPDTWDSLLFKLASSVAFAAAGVKAYPKLYEEIGKTGILGQANKKHAMDLSSGVALITCARGCCQGTVVCLTEMGEILGGMTSSFQKRKVASSGGQHHGGV
jgi:hypothetical protein